MFVLLRIVRGFFGMVAALQIFGLIPVLGWISSPDDITGNMMAILTIKFIVLMVAGAVFFGMRLLINSIYKKKHGSPHPSLASKWAL